VHADLLSDVPNAGSYYCRKGYHSLNFQVCCDAERRITWTSAQFCGSTHDNVALENSQLGAILTNPEHPINKTDYWLAGDDAYKGVAGKSDSILTPYPASRTYDDEKDAFNFYQSKLRIEVECCFGALVHRWGILQRKLQVDNLYKVNLLLSVVCKLHNVCMERKLPDHVGRVLSDRYGEKTRAGDLWGGDWADWRLPQNDEDDDTDRAARIRSRHQRLRDALRDTLATHRKKRPPRSQWRPEMQRPRRTR
jgi:hypothetical protein